MGGTGWASRCGRAFAAVVMVAGVGAVAVGPLATPAAASSTFVVNSNGNGADAIVGDGNCATSVSTCTLRAAIQEANADATPDTDTITFTGLTANARITVPTAGLPPVTQPVHLDATATRIRLDGVGNNPPFGLHLGAGSGGSTVRGFTIVRMQVGVLVESDGNTVAANVIGISETSTTSCTTPTTDCTNATGIEIRDVDDNVVGGTTAATRNVISNNHVGVRVSSANGDSADNTISGNYIGTDAAGTTALGNVHGAVLNGAVSGTVVGGTTSGAGNVISGNTFAGVSVEVATGTVLAGNLVGLSPSGTTAVANDTGIRVTSADTTIGGATPAHRNVVSGNSANGIYVHSTVDTGLTVQHNYVGTDINGTGDLGNAGSGLVIDGANGAVISHNVIAGNSHDQIHLTGCSSCSPQTGMGYDVNSNIIGLAEDGASTLLNPSPVPNGNGIYGIVAGDTTDLVIDGNIVSANGIDGIHLSTAARATITDNLIGTDETGTVGFGNNQAGIAGYSLSESTIGGPGHGNVISGNNDPGFTTGDNPGILLQNSDLVTLQANLIGTDASGTAAIPNDGIGIQLWDSSALTVGGSGAGEGNVVAGSPYDGIQLLGTDTSTVSGNNVGVGADDTTDLGNGGSGIVLHNRADRNVIGGDAPAAGNLVAGNTLHGIAVHSGIGNTVRANDLRDNDGLGIDLDANGITANDLQDADSGPNRRQNFPVLTSAGTSAAGTQVHGSLNSRPNRQFQLDFYASAACDSLGNGEGSEYLGSATVVADGNGDATFVASLSTSVAVDDVVTATATDVVLGDTSEFSACEAAAPIPTVALSPATPSVGEGATSVTLTATLSAAPTLEPVTVDFTTVTGTATGADLTPQNGTLTFATGDTTETITVPLTNDTLDEDAETFTVTLSNPVNTLISSGGSQSTVTIVDDDATPTLTVADAPDVAETAGGATQTFTLTLSAASSKTVTVLASTEAVSAAADADYVSAVQEVTFAPGTTTQLVDVTVNDDLIDEDAETYELLLAQPTNATIADGTGVGTITDDDTWPTISIAADADPVDEEGDAAFTLTLSAASTQTVTVSWQTADGTAGSADYTQQAPQVVTFVPGDTSESVSVPVTVDAIDEADETFSVTLSDPTNAFLAGTSEEVTIADDDATPTLSVADATNVTEAVGGGTQSFVVTLSAASGLGVSVVAATTPGTAGGLDFTSVASSLVFPAGTTQQILQVAVLDDDLDEPNETYSVDLSSPVNAGIADGSGSGTILDDDIYPSISVTPASPSTAESGAVSFDVVLSEPSNQTVTVSWSTSNGTATAPADYTAQAATLLTFAPGVTSQPIEVAIANDALDEDNETFSINLTGPTHGSVAGGSTVTITDNDATPSLSFGSTPSRTETPGGVNQSFRINLSAASGRPVTVVATTVSPAGSATAGSDYQPLASVVTFAPGETSKLFTVLVLDDTISEPSQAYEVHLFSPTNATVATPTKSGTILDNDPLPQVSVGDASIVEGDSGTVQLTFELTLSAASERNIEVTASAADGTAVARVDYGPRTQRPRFSPGVVKLTISIKVIPDNITELDETMLINLSLPDNATIGDGQGVGTIINDD